MARRLDDPGAFENLKGWSGMTGEAVAADRLRVMLVDDHALVRTSVASLLATCPDIQVVGEAEDGAQAVARAAELMPDLILMDIQMPTMDGLEATRRIKAAHPSLKIVMLTVVEEERSLSEALRAGAEGYLLKSVDPDEFLARVRNISRRNAPQRLGDTERTTFASVPDQDAGTSKDFHAPPVV
jgi:two-component system, NarL family, nitrate/nitrite response regulator NarL